MEAFKPAVMRKDADLPESGCTVRVMVVMPVCAIGLLERPSKRISPAYWSCGWSRIKLLLEKWAAFVAFLVTVRLDV